MKCVLATDTQVHEKSTKEIGYLPLSSNSWRRPADLAYLIINTHLYNPFADKLLSDTKLLISQLSYIA